MSRWYIFVPPGGAILSHRLQLGEDKKLKLQIFVDKWCLDVIVNDGRLFETRVMYPEHGDDGVEIYAIDGSVKVESINAWMLKKFYGRKTNLKIAKLK